MPTSELALMLERFRPEQPLRSLILLVCLESEVAVAPFLLEQEMVSIQDQEERAKDPRMTTYRWLCARLLGETCEAYKQ